MNVVDSSGWIEYLQDTHRADFFAAAIEDRAHLLVPTIALLEVHRVLSRSLPVPDGQSKFPHPWLPQIPPGSAVKL